MEAKMMKALSSINSTFDNWIINNIFEEINLEHAKISCQLSYLIKLHFKVIIPKVNCNQALEKCLENLSILLRSANEKQKIHNLHLFKYLLRKYLRITDKQLQYTNPDSSEIVECNQKNYYPKGLNLQEFSKIERAYLDSQKLNEWMVDIVNSDIRLPNNECVCCTELFIHNFQIRNNNPLFPHVIGLRENESEDFNLERYICAICNSGGGVLVIGAETNNSRVWATGVNFKSAYDVQEKQNQLLRSGMYIQPEFEFSVDKLRVHSNFLDQGQNIMKEQNRFCFRIKILPRQINKKHYIQIFNKGYHNLYETYQLDQNLNYFRIDSDESNPSQTDKLFFLIQECYRSKKIAKISSHKGIKCCQPYNFPSKLFTKNLSQNNLKVQKVQDKEKNDNYSDKDEPTFKYTYTSLLAVGSKKKDKYIHDLVAFMKKKKMLFREEKPFQHSFKEGPRSIWMFSHNDRHDFLKNCIKECDKTGSITMIPVYKTLQIDKCRVSEQCRLEIENKFIKRYPEGFRKEEIIAEDEHGIIRQPLIMLFNSYIHAIYAYMIFESMQLRPYFVKQNTLYKKKSKFKENELNWI